MNLKSLFKTDEALITLKRFSMISIVLSFLSVGTSFYLYIKMSNSHWVRTPNGEYFEVNRTDNIPVEDRQQDFILHTETVLNLLYAVNEGNYHKNTEDVLFLMGESGKTIIDNFESNGVYNFLVSNNAISSVDSVKVTQLDMSKYQDTEMALGKVTFIQTISIGNKKKNRYGEASFQIYDISRWQKNRLGAKIELEEPTFYEK